MTSKGNSQGSSRGATCEDLLSAEKTAMPDAVPRETDVDTKGSWEHRMC